MSSEEIYNNLDFFKEIDSDSLNYRKKYIKWLLFGTKLELLINDFKDDIPDIYKNNTMYILKKKSYDFKSIIASMDGRLDYVKSGGYGHVFRGTLNKYPHNIEELNFGVKIVAYQKHKDYGDIYNIKRPENAEIMMIKILSQFVIKKQTPYIVLPITTFYAKIDTFIKNYHNGKIQVKEKKHKDDKTDGYTRFVNRYHEGYFYDKVSVLISEWANRGDLLSFIKSNYRDFELKHWKVLFFQIISVLAVIQYKYPAFRHNDMKANNILVSSIKSKTEFMEHTINNYKYLVPIIGYQIKLWDFDFACIPGIVDNLKVEDAWTTRLNVTPVQNRYYDLHYFFNTLERFFPPLTKGTHVPKEVRDFVNRIIPQEFREKENLTGSKGDRLKLQIEYLIPEEILKNDEFFKEYRVGFTKKMEKRNVLTFDSVLDDNFIPFLNNNGNDNKLKSNKEININKNNKEIYRNREINYKKMQSYRQNINNTKFKLNENNKNFNENNKNLNENNNKFNNRSKFNDIRNYKYKQNQDSDNDNEQDINDRLRFNNIKQKKINLNVKKDIALSKKTNGINYINISDD